MQVGYVIPSIGRDLLQLEEAIQSVLGQSPDVGLVIVAPANAIQVRQVAKNYGLPVVNDDLKGVPAAFNIGINYLSELGVEYFGVLGEDDQLISHSTTNLVTGFKNSEVQAVVGRIWYVNEFGRVVFHNRAFPKLLPFLHLIPNVIPHPGSLCRISAWRIVGGFNEKLIFASDLDFWLRIRKLGKIERVECPMSFFGFSNLGNTARFRSASISEGRMVRKSHTNWILYPIQNVLEYFLTRLGEILVQRRNN
jgi:glycosyltransferase involved in cell wall biosynthesis